MQNPNAYFESRLADYLKAIESIESAYVEVANQLEPEHRAIMQRDLKEIERITPIKVLAGEKFECAVSAFKKAWRHEVMNKDDRGSVSLGSVLTYLKEQSKVFTEDSAQALMTSCERAFERLVKLREKTEPRMKMNKYLLEKMLRFHQENYRFVQEVLAESEATYGNQGNRNVTQRHSIITVKV